MLWKLGFVAQGGSDQAPGVPGLRIDKVNGTRSPERSPDRQPAQPAVKENRLIPGYGRNRQIFPFFQEEKQSRGVGRGGRSDPGEHRLPFGIVKWMHIGH